MTIELTCRQKPGRATQSTEGWLEGDSRQIFRLIGMQELSDLDARLSGNVSISRVISNETRCPLKGSGPITVEGRKLVVGDHVRIMMGGEILWGR